MERAGFLTAGTWCVDRNITVERWPEEDMAVEAGAIELSGGGSACNFAVAIRRLDPAVPVETQGLVGAGGFGDLVVEIADRHGIDRRGLHRSGEDRTQATDAYLSEATGRRTHVLFLGLARALTPEHFDLSATRARTLHLGLPGLHEIMDAPWKGDANGWVTVLKAARAAGIETNLELVANAPEEIRRLALPCLPHLTTLVVNDQEIGAIAGRETVRGGVTDEASCEAAAQMLLGEGAMELVVVHFPAAAILVARDGAVIRQPSVAIPDAARVGANGAGDAFAAGFFLARHRGEAPADCLRLGHAVAAASLRAADTFSAIESAAACRALADGWGWRQPAGAMT